MNGLRHGFTTGTAAAAAAKAACMVLAGLDPGEAVDTPLPGGSRLHVPLAGAGRLGPGAAAWVVKDAGDDPDVTHGAVIRVRAVRAAEPGLVLEGGDGVGRVTLPGLPVAVGRAAINPVPARQIKRAAAEVRGAPPGLRLVVEVPGGAEMAAGTMNPQLGIVGGISILGTRGTVKPFSHAAWKSAVVSGLKVARAGGLSSIYFTTGGRSERFLRRVLEEPPRGGVIQAADHFAFACSRAAGLGFTHVSWAVMPGKLVKQAQGNADTHARASRLDFSDLARLMAVHGLDGCLEEARRARTVRRVVEIVNQNGCREASGTSEVTGVSGASRSLWADLARSAAEHARTFAGPGVSCACLVFGYDGSLLASVRLAREPGKAAP
jgi:cobalt-precorrin-5B (C1)-methyltransferase